MTGENTQTSLRDDINAAIEQIESKDKEIEVEVEAEPEAVADKPARERDETGKFKKKSDKAEEPEKVEEKIEAEPEQPVPIIAELKPPQSLKGELKAKWKELPIEVQNEFVRLESTQAKGMAKIAQTAKFGEEVMNEVQPYMAMIQAEGGTPQAAIKSLLNTAYLLRTAPPAHKQQLIYQLANQYGVDLSNPPEQKQVDPNIQHILNELNQIKQQQTGQVTANQQAADQALETEIQQFASDPKNIHFEELKGVMSGLLTSGVASGLQDAYEQACWANPEIRNSILSEQKRQDEFKRKEEEKKLIARKKGAATTLKSDPSGTVDVPTGDETLRQTLERQFYGNSQRI